MAPPAGQSSTFDLRKRLWQRRRYDRLATTEKEGNGEDDNPNPAGLGSSGGQDLNSNLRDFDANEIENEDLELAAMGEAVEIEEWVFRK